MRILVLGGYGLIGSAVVGALDAAGHAVVGLGRDVARASIAMPHVHWIAADLNRLDSAAAWRPVLAAAAVDAVVNCAGVLQDGGGDDVAAVHRRAIFALVDAMEAAGPMRFIQISATGASPESSSAFMRTKGEADARISASRIDWTILRPGLVMSPQAYGGSALLRALAAVPLVQPMVFADAMLQTVAVTDVADAVVASIDGQVPSRRIFDLVEDTPHRFADVVADVRGWLGLAPAPTVTIPSLLVRVTGVGADLIGRLGWRSPLRSTALGEIARGVRGDPGPWRDAGGIPIGSLAQTLRRNPAGVQERWFANLYLLKAAAIGVLAVFWIASGIIGVCQFGEAASILQLRGVAAAMAAAIVIGGAAIDVALGLAILMRRWVVPAAAGMIAATVCYLGGATILAPDLWLDPLGPLVKTVPAAMLALIVLALAEDR